MNLKWAILLSIICLMFGCNERYRYPCQDPENWDKKECKKPFCSANGTCPEDLTHYEKEKPGIKPPTFYASAPESKKGECK